MAQPAPKIIDLSTLWSDSNGDRPGTGYTQIPRGAERHTKYLEKVTNAFNRDAQLVAVHGQIKLVGDLPRGYTFWSTNTGVEWVFGHPSQKCRAASNFKDHVGELLAANDLKVNYMRAVVRAANDGASEALIDETNKTATRCNALLGTQYPDDWDIKHHYLADPSLVRRDADAEIQADRQANPAIAFDCSCKFH